LSAERFAVTINAQKQFTTFPEGDKCLLSPMPAGTHVCCTVLTASTTRVPVFRVQMTTNHDLLISFGWSKKFKSWSNYSWKNHSWSQACDCNVC